MSTPESSPLGPRPTLPPQPKAPDWDDYWAHQVAEKAKKKVLAYFGLATLLVSALVTLYGVGGLSKLLEDRFTKVIESKEKEAIARIESRMQAFEADIDSRKARVQTRSEEFEKLIALRAQAVETTPPAQPHKANVIDLSGEIGSIRDTGPEGTTVGFAVAYAMQAAIKSDIGEQVVLSPRGIYEIAKKHDEWPGDDYEGTSLSGAMKALREIGAYLETEWPYSSKKAPPASSKPQYRIVSFERVRTVSGIIEALKRRSPVPAAVAVNEDFAKAGKDGRVIIRSAKQDGVKALCIVGYDPSRAEFRFANDWGKSWGLEGFGFLKHNDLEKLLVDAYIFQVQKL